MQLSGWAASISSRAPAAPCGGRPSGLLAFADLHFEKGSSYARHGLLLPPYDTRETLLRMTAEIDRLDPATVVCLGDSSTILALGRACIATMRFLVALAHRRRWVWVAGNHDAEFPPCCPAKSWPSSNAAA